MEVNERPTKKRRLDEDPASPDTVREQRTAFLNSLSRTITPPRAAASRSDHNDGSKENRGPTDLQMAGSPGTEDVFLQGMNSEGVNPSLLVVLDKTEAKQKNAPTKESPKLERNRSQRDQSKSPRIGVSKPWTALDGGSLSTKDVIPETTSNEEDFSTEGLSSTRPPLVSQQPHLIPSPFQLTHIRDLPDTDNKDTIKLADILGDPLIEEAWIFNYCFDIDFIMRHFDPDVRQLVRVKIVHGYCRRDDPNRKAIESACSRWKNVSDIPAYLPDPFGTHHSKMFILFRHDEHAQVIIHTANMLEKDWTNMTQAVWRSPLLPLIKSKHDRAAFASASAKPGTGRRFKHDLYEYVRTYGSRLSKLLPRIEKYSFDEVRGALIASTPTKIRTDHREHDSREWGYLALDGVLSYIERHTSQTASPTPGHVVCQVSSIARLPPSWLDTFSKIILPDLLPDSPSTRMSIIFPTADDVRQSLDGYASGGSIHAKTQSDAHRAQIELIRPRLCRWMPEDGKETTTAKATKPEVHKPDNRKHALRHLAAPHIKTYIKFSRQPTSEHPAPDIEWALLTSANLSTQAWGKETKVQVRVPSTRNIVHVMSYEIGVMVWPDLFRDHQPKEPFSETAVSENAISTFSPFETSSPRKRSVKMVPVVGQDTFTPGEKTLRPLGKEKLEGADVIVGIRMPYDLPLTPYKKRELPWSPQAVYKEVDRFGRTWPPDETWLNGKAAKEIMDEA